MRVVLATGNTGKLRELATHLQPLGFDLITLTERGVSTPPETGETFADNALLKARHAARHTHLPSLADDSGIEVDALGGRPGVFSARYAGDTATDADNVCKMLHELSDVPDGRRAARFRCVLAFVRSGDDPAPILATGVWEGSILRAPRGSGGFGYDPIFVPRGSDRSVAEWSAEEKTASSHRARALQAFIARLRQEGA